MVDLSKHAADLVRGASSIARRFFARKTGASSRRVSPSEPASSVADPVYRSSTDGQSKEVRRASGRLSGPVSSLRAQEGTVCSTAVTGTSKSRGDAAAAASRLVAAVDEPQSPVVSSTSRPANHVASPVRADGLTGVVLSCAFGGAFLLLPAGVDVFAVLLAHAALRLLLLARRWPPVSTRDELRDSLA